MKLKNNTQLIILLIIFSFPIIGGWILYHYRNHFEFKTIAHGVLVHPPIVLKNLNIATHDKKWKIIYSPKHCCDKQCDTLMYTLHQLRIAFDKDSQRISLAVMINSNDKLENSHDFKKMLLSPKQKKQLSMLLSKQSEKEFALQDKIYLVDPLGNLFMYYSASDDPIHILTDLKRVLEVSQIG